jgi:hypothetical protein
VGASTIITQQTLDLAGISGVLGTVLLGKTVAEASDVLLDVVQLAIAAAGILRKNVVSFTLQGQTTTTSMDDAVKLVAFIQRMKSAGNGPVQIPVRFVS